MRLTVASLLAAFSAMIVFAISLSSPNVATTRANQSSDQPVVARVTIKDDDRLLRFVSLGLDLLEMRAGDDLFILTTQEQIEQLRNDGWQIRVDDELTTQTAQLSPETFRDGYRTVA
jgi:hypothetical protein